MSARLRPLPLGCAVLALCGCYDLTDFARDFRPDGGALDLAAQLDDMASTDQSTGDLAAADLTLALATFEAVADTYLRSDTPTTSYAAATYLAVDEDPQDYHRALLRFDLSALPSGATIESAVLLLRVTNQYGNLGLPPNGTTVVYGVLEPWSESQATWDEQNAGNAWAGPGCGPSSRDAVPTAMFMPGAVDEPSQVEIRPLVAAWVSGVRSNYGLLLAQAGADGVEFHSVEGPAASRPQLVVQYRR